MTEEIDFKARAREIYGETYKEPIYYSRLFVGFDDLREIIDNGEYINLEDFYRYIWLGGIMGSYGSLCDPRISPENEFEEIKRISFGKCSNINFSNLKTKEDFKELISLYFNMANKFRANKHADINDVAPSNIKDNIFYNFIDVLNSPCLDIHHGEYWGYEWWG